VKKNAYEGGLENLLWFLNNLFYERRKACPSSKREIYTIGPIFPLLSILFSMK
jgi:hypothetical protein